MHFEYLGEYFWFAMPGDTLRRATPCTLARTLPSSVLRVAPHLTRGVPASISERFPE